MAPVQKLVHPDDAQLASFLDPALPPEALESLAAHLDACPACEARLDQMEPAFSEYRRGLETLHSRVPRRNSDGNRELWTKMEQLEASRRPMRPRSVWLFSIAAGLAGLAIFLIPLGRGSEARAEALLARAASNAQAVRPARQLRIRTLSASYIRPVILTSGTSARGEEASVREHFAAAHYDWRDPLNARAYSDWRHALKQKTSKISKGRNDDTLIETLTDQGVLRDASLTLDSTLVPVSGWFRFADEQWVEITLVPDSSVGPAPNPVVRHAKAPPLTDRAAPETIPAEPLAERELNLRLAVDSLGADPSEPVEIEVSPEGALSVTAYGLTPERERQLRAALGTIPGVTIAFASNQRQSPSQPADLVDRMLRSSQEVSFEAHLLADLASRFDPAVEMTLRSSSRVSLSELRSKHLRRVNDDLTNLLGDLKKDHPNFHPEPEPVEISAQLLAQSATAVDRLVTVLYAGQQPESAQAELWRELEREFGKLQRRAAEIQ